MPVVFPYANRHQIEDATFVAAWKIWFELHRPQETGSWSSASMPRLHRKEGLSAQLNGGRAASLDVLCRMLVPWSYRNTMQATDLFMSSNAHLLQRVKTMSPNRREVQGARLSDAAVQCWGRLTEQQRDELEGEMEARFSADIEVRGSTTVHAALLGETSQPDLPPPEAAAVLVDPGTDYEALVRAIVTQIELERFQPMYRRNPHGDCVTGWSARLASYFWPRPSVGLDQTHETIQALVDRITPLAQAADVGNAWSLQEEKDAVEAAIAIHRWGGVTQPMFEARDVREVIEAALSGKPGGPMNSGWTKVAALATEWLEAEEGRSPQVIWDSRVATSLTWRLDKLLSAATGNPREVFPGIGTVAGRGGTRPRPLLLDWPNAYGKWEGQFAGSDLVSKIRNELNRREMQMPLPGGMTGPWTLRGTEQVLFMDGY
jgi:hypothetical protein